MEDFNLEAEQGCGEPIQQPPHLRVRRLQAKETLETLAEKLGMDLVRDSLPAQVPPVVNLDVLDLHGNGNGEENNGEI